MKTHVKRASVYLLIFALGIFCFLLHNSYRMPAECANVETVFGAEYFTVGETISSDQMFANATGKTITLSVPDCNDVDVWNGTEFSLADVVGAGKTLKIESVSGLDGITITFSVVEPVQHTHDYKETLVKSATCTESATYVMKCECGQENGEAYPSGEPLGHAITAFRISENPTKTAYIEGETIDSDGLEVVADCSREGCAGFALTAEQYSVAKTALAVSDKSVAVTIDKESLPTADYSDVSTYVLSIPVTVTAKPRLTVPEDAITSVECVYDGEEHKINYDLTKICEANDITEVQIFFKTTSIGNYLDSDVTRKDVGETTVYWALTATTHTRADGTATIKITRRPATVTVHDVTANKGDEYVNPTFESEGLLPEDEENVSIDCPTFKDEPGTYTVTATLTQNEDNYDLTVEEGTYTVKDASAPEPDADPDIDPDVDPDVDPKPENPDTDPEPIVPDEDTEHRDTVPETQDNAETNADTSLSSSSQTDGQAEQKDNALSNGATLAICIGAVVVLVALPFLIRKLVKRKGK